MRVDSAGFGLTVQDLGRFGYQYAGVPVGGAVDRFAARSANLLTGNDEGAGLLEWFAGEVRLTASRRTVAAVCGALSLRPEASPRDEPGRFSAVPPWAAVELAPGSSLRVAGPGNGAPAYVAVAGGIVPDLVLGSRSTYVRASLGGLEGRVLKAGDLLPVGASSLQCGRAASGPPIRVLWRMRPPEWYRTAGRRLIRVLSGPERALCPVGSLDAEFSVSARSDRMARRLEPVEEGERPLLSTSPELASEGIVEGAVQVPPDMRPVVLMAERQTTGGYPVPWIVAQADIPRFAQIPAGGRLQFLEVSRAEAHAALLQQEEWLRTLALAVRIRDLGHLRAAD